MGRDVKIGKLRVASLSILAAFALYVFWLSFGDTKMYGALLVSAILILTVFVIFRVARRLVLDHWVSSSPNGQLGRVIMVIAIMLAAQLCGGFFLDNFFTLDETSSIILSSLSLVGAIIISTCLGFISWPHRQNPSPVMYVAIVSIIAMMATLSLIYWIDLPKLNSTVLLNKSSTFYFLSFALLMSAFAEEAIFRKLLIPEIMRWASPFDAVVISSAVFALAHAAIVIGYPVLTFDWDASIHAVHEYLTLMLFWQFWGGLVLGALWLRTGSLMLLTFLHAIWNISLLAPDFVA